VTTLDVVRASRFLGEIKDVDPKEIQVTVVGGHSGVTIVPLLSQTSQGKGVSGEQYKALVKRIQFGGDGQSIIIITSRTIAESTQRSYKLKLVLVLLHFQWVSVSYPSA
jgi:malate/lactate dehydrogenase